MFNIRGKSCNRRTSGGELADCRLESKNKTITNFFFNVADSQLVCLLRIRNGVQTSDTTIQKLPTQKI